MGNTANTVNSGSAVAADDASADAAARSVRSDSPVRKARIVLIGTGGRSEMYIRAIYGKHSDTAELVAFSDVNPGRVEFYQKLIQELGASGPVAAFDPADLTAFIQDNDIDRVVVTTPDYTHADYIVRALEAGADVVVEKPLTIDAESAAAIEDAVERTGRRRGAHVQLPLLAAQQRAAAGHPGRPDRRGHLDRLPVDARHQARRGLLPPLAPREEELRRPARAQGQPPLRPRQLVDPRRPGASSPRAACASTAPRTPPSAASALRPERGTHDAGTAGANGSVRARPARRRAPEGALPRRRAPRRLPRATGRVRRGHHDRGQPRARGRLRERSRR